MFRVLVVDDDPAHRAYATCVFEALDCDVTAVSGGMLAVQEAQASHFDLILMDRLMPVCDGDTATRAIRASGASRRAIIVCHTAMLPGDRVAPMYDRALPKPATVYGVRDLIPGNPQPKRFTIDMKAFRQPSRGCVAA